MIATTPSGTRTRVICEPVGPGPAVEHLADRVGESGDRAQPVGHAREARVGEAQAVERPGRHAARLRGLEVGVVGGLDLGRPLERAGRPR